MQRKVTPEQFKEWEENPITMRLKQFLNEEATVRKTFIADGSCKRDSIFETGEQYTLQIIAADIYSQLANISYEDLFLEEEDDADSTSRT